MTDYIFNVKNAPLILEALNFIKERLENCDINETKKEGVIRDIEGTKDLLHKKLKLQTPILKVNVKNLAVDIVKSALTVYREDGEVWFSDKQKFKKIQKAIDDELRLKMYDDRNAKLFDQYYKCFKKELKF